MNTTTPWTAGMAGACLFFLSGTALGEPADFGPTINDSPGLDQSLLVLNRHLQDKYLQEDLLASLHEPRDDDDARFEQLASMMAPGMPRAQVAGDFGLTVGDDRSLNASLHAFQVEYAMRRDDAFMAASTQTQYANQDITGEDFMAAMVLIHERSRLDEQRHYAAVGSTGFGDPVHDGATLNWHLAALNQRIQELDAQAELMVAGTPPWVRGSSFDAFAVALHYSY